jgi:hypothetical protein
MDLTGDGRGGAGARASAPLVSRSKAGRGPPPPPPPGPEGGGVAAPLDASAPNLPICDRTPLEKSRNGPETPAPPSGAPIRPAARRWTTAVRRAGRGADRPADGQQRSRQARGPPAPRLRNLHAKNVSARRRDPRTAAAVGQRRRHCPGHVPTPTGASICHMVSCADSGPTSHPVNPPGGLTLNQKKYIRAHLSPVPSAFRLRLANSGLFPDCRLSGSNCRLSGLMNWR